MADPPAMFLNMKATTARLLPNPRTTKDSITMGMGSMEIGSKTRSTTMITLAMLRDSNKMNKLKNQDLSHP